VNLTEPILATHVPHAELQLLGEKVTQDGGELRLLSGSDYGLVTSVMHSRVAPGSGPRRNRHPHAEIFVFHGGQADTRSRAPTDARAGDMVIAPPDA
jgi:quercetin dioxygenase-like cupin family protein